MVKSKGKAKTSPVAKTNRKTLRARVATKRSDVKEQKKTVKKPAKKPAKKLAKDIEAPPKAVLAKKGASTKRKKPWAGDTPSAHARGKKAKTASAPKKKPTAKKSPPKRSKAKAPPAKRSAMKQQAESKQTKATKQVRAPAKGKRVANKRAVRAVAPPAAPPAAQRAPASKDSHPATRGLDLLREFVAKKGWAKFHVRLRYKQFHLGHWVSVRRNEFRNGAIDPILAERLSEIPGWSWDPIAKQYRDKVEMLREFAETEGLANLRSKTVVNKVYLGEWAAICRADYREGRLPKWLARELEKIPGWTWEPKQEFHRSALKLLERYIDRHGWDNFRSRTVVRGIDLGGWVTRRRADYRQGQIANWLEESLEAIPGWTWNA